MSDVVIVGGGPAGLSAAIHAARAGLSTLVLERAPGPPDKACGEGLLPRGLRELTALGALRHLDPERCAPLPGIRWVQEDGCAVQTVFREGTGLGVRRTALTEALTLAALEAGATVRFGAAVEGIELSPGGVLLRVGGEELRAKLVVAADGAGSRLRSAAGLDLTPPAPRRFGLRRHFSLHPWSEGVEVHWGEEAEAYVTPVGPRSVGVAFLWEEGRLRGSHSFDALLGRFPALAARLEGAPVHSSIRGAGPLVQRARARARGRLILLGDAAGSVDALTGEGVTLAWRCAAILGAVLPDALRAGASARSLAPYTRSCRRLHARYSAEAALLLAVARRPALRRSILARLARHPPLFTALVSLVE